MHFSGLWEKELSGWLILPSSPACTRNRLFIKGLELQHLCLGGKKAVVNGAQVSAALIYSGRNEKNPLCFSMVNSPCRLVDLKCDR